MSNPDSPEFRVIVVGASAGRVAAPIGLVRGLPADLPAPVLIVQHLSRDRPSALPELLSAAGPLQAGDAIDGEPIRPGRISVAPPGALVRRAMQPVAGPLPGPDIDPAPEPHPGPYPRPNPDPYPNPIPESEPNLDPEPKPKPEPMPEPNPEPKPSPEPNAPPTPVPTPHPDPYPVPAPGPNPEPGPGPIVASGP